MPFILKKFKTIKGKKIQQFLINEVGVSSSFAQKLIAKGRVFGQNKRQIKTNEFLTCDFIEISIFEGQTKGLKPIFVTSDFAVFDKPSGIMVHPISKNTQYTARYACVFLNSFHRLKNSSHQQEWRNPQSRIL